MEEHTYREQYELEDSHWWFEGRRAVIRALLARAGTNGTSAPRVQGGHAGPIRLLDAGCGTGRNMLEFASLGTVEGVDAAPEAIEFCRRRGLNGARVGTVESLPFDEGSFDLILATDVIEHLRDDHAALMELRRVAAPGAKLLATVPAYRWLWSEHDDAHHHFRRYTLRQLRSRLQAAGWRPTDWSYFNSLLLAPIAAVRLSERRRRVGDVKRSDIKPTPPVLNRLLSGPMLLEAALIERGARLPAGVSIGLVAVAGSAS